MDDSRKDPPYCRDGFDSGGDRTFCALHLTTHDVRRLHQILAEQETLLSIIRFHTGLVVMTHALKWLAGIAGAAAVLKGLQLW